MNLCFTSHNVSNWWYHLQFSYHSLGPPLPLQQHYHHLESPIMEHGGYCNCKYQERAVFWHCPLPQISSSPTRLISLEVMSCIETLLGVRAVRRLAVFATVYFLNCNLVSRPEKKSRVVEKLKISWIDCAGPAFDCQDAIWTKILQNHKICVRLVYSLTTRIISCFVVGK